MNKVLKFGAEWCAGCKVVDQQLDRLGLVVEQVDIDSQPDEGKKYSLRSIPTMIKIDSDGKEVSRLIGAQSDAKLIEFLDGI